MLGSMRFRVSVFVAAIAASLCVAAAPAGAQQQQGLVNLNVSDNNVQVPVAVAANVCDVNVAVLVEQLQDDAATCEAAPEAIAISPVEEQQGPGAGANQEGLVNVNIEGNNVQVPISVALNICDVNVAVLVELLDDDAEGCIAEPRAVAQGRGGPPA